VAVASGFAAAPGFVDVAVVVVVLVCDGFRLTNCDCEHEAAMQ
jgi:hypothetical protein